MAVNYNRKMVSREQESITLEYVSLKQARDEIDRLITAYGDDATIEYFTPMYSDTSYMYVFAEVPETDVEMAIRIANEEAIEKSCANRERAEYERLKSKFEGK